MTPDDEDDEESVDANDEDEDEDDAYDRVSGSSVYGVNEGWEYVRESLGISLSWRWYRLRDSMVLMWFWRKLYMVRISWHSETDALISWQPTFDSFLKASSMTSLLCMFWRMMSNSSASLLLSISLF